MFVYARTIHNSFVGLRSSSLALRFLQPLLFSSVALILVACEAKSPVMTCFACQVGARPMAAVEGRTIHAARYR